MSGANTANITGSSFDVNQAVSASFVPICGDATAAGTLKLQCSADIITDGSAPTNWSDIPNATSAISSGVGPAIVIGNMCFKYIRAVYTRTSGGSTTLKVNMNYISI
jgi:hypothetical protein